MSEITDRERVWRAINNAIADADLAANGVYTHLTSTYTDHVIAGLEEAGCQIVASGRLRCDGWIRDRDTEYRVYDGGNGQWEWERIVAGGVVAEGTITANDVADALRLVWECV